MSIFDVSDMVTVGLNCLTIEGYSDMTKDLELEAEERGVEFHAMNGSRVM